jgi:hypothetical protein
MLHTPTVGKVYEIRYAGLYEYDGYSGKGIYTGKHQDISGECYEFIINKDKPEITAFFPLEDVFECN